MQSNIHYYMMTIQEGLVEYNSSLLKEFYEVLPDTEHKMIIKDLGNVTIIELYLREHVKAIDKYMYTMYGYIVITE